jgi:solute carrier family 25 protein 34/35
MAARQQPSLSESLLLGGTATAAACVFSNPLGRPAMRLVSRAPASESPWPRRAEVVKTRMQLQNELVATHAAGARVAYRNIFHAIYVILREEGVRGIQRGLLSGMGYQFVMNGVRLGSYPFVQRQLGATEPGTRGFFLRNLLSGAITGAAGAFIGSPLFLIKVRLQTQSSAAGLRVGHQHDYAGVVDGLRKVLRAEGVRGLWRGVGSAIPRVVVGSSVQLATYDSFKRLLMERAGLARDSVLTHLGASFSAGFCVATAMNPFDLVSTRLYNQRVGPEARGALYSGVVDCFAKTLRAEGPRGLYKGFFAQWLRIGPHTVLTFVFLEQLKIATGYA